MRVGVDTGGTFTDVVVDDGRVVKVLSTPADPSRAVAEGLRALGGETVALAHGTTVATNALLERNGATVALVATDGFGDVIEIGRQDRPSLYDPWADRPDPLVPREWRLEVAGRVAADGTELQPLGPVPVVPPGVGAVAVCLLHADLNPAHERAVANELRARGYDVTASSEIAPEFREYERTVTTVACAYLRPVCRSYLTALTAMAPAVQVLTSAGGLVPVAAAAENPAALLLSGPAGGVLAAAAAGVAAGFPNAVTFDMGGTSTDVCLVLDGRPAPAAQRLVAGFPIRLPALDVHTIGAGGGSIAHLDAGGALTVGPRSAGAVPGPACYGRGGTDPTVTDADLVAGRLPLGTRLPGIGELSVERAQRALADAGPGVSADGVIAVVDAAMAEAVRVVTVHRGVDPEALALVAFGGAGPLHACAVARALGMRVVVIPSRAGVLAAVGLLASPAQADGVRSWATPDDHRGLDAALADLAREVANQVDGDSVVETSVDCRYRGQGHELTVPDVAGFEAEHERVNGYKRPGTPVEVVALRATARVPSPVALADLPVGARGRTVPSGRQEASGPRAGPGVGAAAPSAVVHGPMAMAEPDCAIWVPDGWHGEVHPSGAWVIRR
jgi:N-methylhydantoinase A/oxoprolinase/acetone carboxylase beta subunit